MVDKTEDLSLRYNLSVSSERLLQRDIREETGYTGVFAGKDQKKKNVVRYQKIIANHT